MRGWVGVLVLLVAVAAGWSQDDEAARANALYLQGKRPEALPLYENLALAHPDQMLYFERLADCLGATSIQTSDPAQVKALRIRERDAARRAVELGDTLEYVKMMANLDPDASVIIAPESAGGVLLQEGEKAFTAGDYKTAMDKYAAAAEADPHLYQARLYAGDTAYATKDLPTAARWFAEAIQVDPNRETAYRYWGDAIMRYGNDPAAAREKFVDAIVAEPYSKLAWQGLSQWATTEKAILTAPRIDRPIAPQVDPDKPNTTNIVIDVNTLNEKKDPGGFAWMMYSMVRGTYHGDTFKKNFPDEKDYRHTLKEEDAALSVVASTVEEKKIKANKLDESLRNLVELHQAGMLDCWILINGADAGIQQDYAGYRKEHRQLLHDYLEKFVVHGGTVTPH